MKDTIKKMTVWTMLLAFSLTTPVSSALALGVNGDLLAYSDDYMPAIRGSQPSTVQLQADGGITNQTLPVSLSLRDSDVKQVLRMFADKAGLNIIFKGDISGTVTMDLVNIPLNSAFNMVLTTSDLGYTLQDNTLIITRVDDKSAVGKQEMAVIPVKYIDAGAAAKFLNKNIYGMKKPGLSGSEIATTNPATNEVLIFGTENDVAIAKRVISQFDKKPVVTSFKVNHTTPAQMADMICTLLLPSTGAGEGATGGAAGIVTGGAAEGGGSDITLGEGTIACSGSTGVDAEANASLGLKSLSVAYYTQLGTVNLIGGSEQQIEMVKDFIAENDKRQPQAYIEFSIIELSETGSREFNNAWSFTSKHFSFNSDNQGTSSFGTDGIGILGGDKRPTYGTGTSSLVYTINMILSNGKGRTISNPRILVTNGQESTIDMTGDYVKTVTSQVVSGTISSTPTVQRTYEIGDDEGIKITVTPFISPDGYVYLNIKPDYTTVKEKIYAAAQDEEAAAAGVQDLQATLLQKRNLELKNVRIKDGDTLVIGGMMRETETKNVYKIPFLGDIPGLGTFFRSSNVNKERSELVILITPKIITDSDTTSTDAL